MLENESFTFVCARNLIVSKKKIDKYDPLKRQKRRKGKSRDRKEEGFRIRREYTKFYSEIAHVSMM